MCKCVRAMRMSLASLILAGLFVAAAPASNPPEKPAKAPESSPSPAQDSESGLPAAQVKDSPAVVAKIGEYEITKDDLIERLAMEIRPRSEGYTAPHKPVTAEAVLLGLIAEKAMILEGRKLGSLRDPLVLAYLERQRKQKLGTMVIMDHVRKNLTVSEAEIDEMMKRDSKLTRERAGMLVQQAKGRALLEQFYQQLFAKFHFKQMQENFPKISAIHERLMNHPTTPRREGWILNSQVRNELTDEEKGIVLATYDGGKVTLQDWFEGLCEIVPPRRPTNLNTAEGVEQLLGRPLRSAMLVAEAKARGYDKNPEYLREIRALEDQQILYSVQNSRVKDIPEPNEGQIKAFYEKNQEWFAEGPSLKVDQIWCKDLATAREVKAKLDGGADFRSMKEAHSLQKNTEPYNVHRNSEGPFWEDLWKGEPNQVAGPVKGFYEQGIAWRVVKILEKTPAKVTPYDEQLGNTIKWVTLGAQRKALTDLYGKELRERYKYELYADRIKGIDPLDPALYEQMKE